MDKSKILPSVLTDIVDFIFPKVCHLCGTELTDRERFVCAGCLARMPRTLYHRRKNNPMEMRFAGKFQFVSASGHFFYSRESALSTLIQDLKYRKFKGIGSFLGETIAKELYTSAFLNDIDYIMPVPMYFLKKARRGYNQTEEIAKGISAITGIPVSLDLKATKPHSTQTSLSAEERLKNTSGIFRLNNPENYENKGLLLLDDVCTTGSTLISAADAIIAGAPTAKITLLTAGVTF